MSRRKWAIVLILLLAAVMRLWLLTAVPPGMTHDEADHGLDAWGVVQGIRPIYFPTAYGREPFFDYATALLMSFMGPTFLAGRLTSVFFSLILIAATYAWTRIAFNTRVALLTAAGLTVNFWALLTARHALRSVTLPAIFMLAVYFFWRSLKSPSPQPSPVGRGSQNTHLLVSLSSCLLAGLLLGTSFYTYIPSRILWTLFPALLGYWLLFDRASLRAHWLKTVAMLVVAGAIAYPLFSHLATSGDEVRLDALDGPIEAARNGDFDPLVRNTIGALRLFTIEGDNGPVSIRYNLLGRPLLTTAVGGLFYAGIVLSLLATLLAEREDKETKKPKRTGSAQHAFALMWLIAGLSPALVTGPEAATTRAIGMQPVLFVFPAIALDFIWGFFGRKTPNTTARKQLGNVLATITVIILFAYVGVNTARAYFIEWANLPDVRVQYETTRVTAIEWLNQNGSGVVAMASPRPDRFHDPSTALMTLRNSDVQLRWFNGKSDDATSGSLLLPDATDGTLMISSWGALHPALQPYLADIEPAESLIMREDDLDRPVDIYQLDTRQHALDLGQRMTMIEPVMFGENVELLGYELISQAPTVQLATMWRIHKPIDGLKLFTHLSNDPTQPPAANEDSLDAPSYYWQPNDVFIQLHQFPVPADANGQYALNVGAYTQPAPNQFIRLVTPVGDSYPVTTITVP